MTINQTRRRAGRTQDLAWATVGRFITATFVLVVASSGREAESDTVITLVSQGGAAALFFLQLTVLVVVPIYARGESGRHARSVLMSLAGIVGVVLAAAAPVLVRAIGLEPTRGVIASWVALALAAPLAVLVGHLVAAGHSTATSGFRFLVPATGPVLALVAWSLSCSAAEVATCWAAGLMIDYLILRRTATAVAPVPGIARARYGRTAIAGALSLQLTAMTASAFQLGVLNRMENGFTSAFYSADRIVLGAVALVGAVLVPRILAGREPAMDSVRVRWFLLLVVLPSVASLASIRLLPWPGGGLWLTACVSTVLVMGTTAFLFQQSAQAQLMRLQHPWRATIVGLTSMVINIGGSLVALSLGNPYVIPFAVVVSACVASSVALTMLKVGR